MNIYIVLEGERGSKKIYRKWIQIVNPELSAVNYLVDVKDNNYFILAGFGQPHFLERVDNAVEDVNNLGQFDRLVVGVDSEEFSEHEKYLEVSNRVDRIGCRVEVKYVIQHFCLETWLLGNIHMFRRNAGDVDLVEYMNIFNIRVNDPEDLPNYETRAWNRAQFAYHYLRAGIRDVHRGNRSYTKKNSSVVAREGYFTQVKRRCIDEEHIQSFNSFLNAFV